MVDCIPIFHPKHEMSKNSAITSGQYVKIVGSNLFMMKTILLSQTIKTRQLVLNISYYLFMFSLKMVWIKFVDIWMLIQNFIIINLAIMFIFLFNGMYFCDTMNCFEYVNLCWSRNINELLIDCRHLMVDCSYSIALNMWICIGLEILMSYPLIA